MTISHWILLRVRNVSKAPCRENQNTLPIFTDFFFDNNAIYETRSKNMVKSESLQMAIWRRIACSVNRTMCAQAHVSVRAHTLTRTHTLRRARARTHTHRGRERSTQYFCFFTATVVSWTRHNLTLHVHCLSFFFFLYIFTLYSVLPPCNFPLIFLIIFDEWRYLWSSSAAFPFPSSV